MKNYKLKKPIDFEGKRIEDFNFDFESMTRKEYKRCIREAKIRNKKDTHPIPVFSETFRLVFAGVAAGVPTEVMFSLYSKDIVGVSSEVITFFFGKDENIDDIDFEDDEEEENNFYKLQDPIEFNGETITEFNFDFDGVNYTEYKRCENDARKLNKKGEPLLSPVDNEYFQLCFAAKAAGKTNDIMLGLSLRDAFNIGIMVHNFLSAGDSDEEEETEPKSIVTTLTEKHKKNMKTAEN